MKEGGCCRDWIGHLRLLGSKTPVNSTGEPRVLITGAAGRFCQILMPQLIEAGYGVLATDVRQLDYDCDCAEDMAQAAFRALEYEPDEPFEAFNVLAGNPFGPGDIHDLHHHPWTALGRCYPGAPDLLKWLTKTNGRERWNSQSSSGSDTAFGHTDPIR